MTKHVIREIEDPACGCVLEQCTLCGEEWPEFFDCEDE